MLDAKSIIETLERNSQALERGLGPQWEEFSRRAGDLAERFKLIAAEDRPDLASQALEAAASKLYMVCQDYPQAAALFDRAAEAPPVTRSGTRSETRLEVGVDRRVPAPAKQDIVKVKETANRYYSLLARMKKEADQRQEGGNDR